MEVIKSTEFRDKHTWTVVAASAKTGLNGARRELEALVEINFLFFCSYFFDIFLFICLRRKGTPQNFSTNGYKVWPMEIMQKL